MTRKKDIATGPVIKAPPPPVVAPPEAQVTVTDAQPAPPPPDAEALRDYIDTNADSEGYLTLTQVAAYCNIHRVTLLRMEQRGAVPKAKWKRLPQPHRVYTKDEARLVKEAVDAVALLKVPEGVEFVA